MESTITNSRVTIRRIRPRTLGGAVLVLALAGETYLMSLHNNAAAAVTEPTSQASAIQNLLSTPQTNSPLCTPAAFDDADQRITRDSTPVSSGQIHPGALKSTPFKQQACSTTGSTRIAAPAVATFQDRGAVLTALADLELQSVIVSETHRTCIINDVACGEGQQIDGFTVETIANGSVTVSTGIYRFELTPRH